MTEKNSHEKRFVDIGFRGSFACELSFGYLVSKN